MITRIPQVRKQSSETIIINYLIGRGITLTCVQSEVFRECVLGLQIRGLLKYYTSQVLSCICSIIDLNYDTEISDAVKRNWYCYNIIMYCTMYDSIILRSVYVISLIAFKCWYFAPNSLNRYEVNGLFVFLPLKQHLAN